MAYCLMAFKISNASLNITYIYLLSYSVIILVPVCQQLFNIGLKQQISICCIKLYNTSVKVCKFTCHIIDTALAINCISTFQIV